MKTMELLHCYLQFLLFTLTFPCWDCSHKGRINIQSARAWNAPASVRKPSFYYFFLAAFKLFQLMSLKRSSCVEGEGDSVREGSHGGINVITYSPKGKKTPGGGWGHPDINWEAEMSSFNTPCTGNKCFIPLTCLCACFVLPSLIKGRGWSGGKKQAPKHSL